MTTPILQANELTKIYAGKVVVNKLSLSLGKGEVLGLLGPNGAGKSTTFGMLYGAVIPSSGSVRVANLDVHKQGQLARRMMGIVTQVSCLDNSLTVLKNLIHFGCYYGLSMPDARARAFEVLKDFNLLDRAHNKLQELSGGFIQRIMLARAMLIKPTLVFLDEPTAGLDPDVRQGFWKLVLDLKNSGCGVLLTTHYMDEAARLCDNLLLLQNGKVVLMGSPHSVIRDTIGEEILEVGGVSLAKIQSSAFGSVSWPCTFSDAILVASSSADMDQIQNVVATLNPTRIVRRTATLEDVFLKLTGHGFGDNT